MNTKIPIGSDDFEKIREQYYFEDKTKFIVDFFQNHADVTLITRPRRFGKTLLMTMMQRFLTIKDAEKNRSLFDGLEVAKHPDVMAEQGTHPVVFMTLKIWSGLTWSTMQQTIKDGLRDVFAPFQFVLSSERVSEVDRELFRAVCAERLTIEQLRPALGLLMRVLEAYYGKRVVLLLDEYDAPIQYAWAHGYYKAAIDFFRAFYSEAFKTNLSLDFAILTGVLRVAKESIFSGLNNLKVSSVISGPYSDACGYTKEEVTKMVNDLGHADKLEEIAAWYDGYLFHGVEIYNPWSVNNYFSEHCDPDVYWVNTSSNDIFQPLLAQANEERWKELTALLTGKTVTLDLQEGIIYDEIGQQNNAIYTILLQTGYLKVVQTVRMTGGRLYELAIPNREIRYLYQKEILHRVDRSYGEVVFYKMGLAMQSGDAGEFQSRFAGILQRAVGVYDTAHPESFYHGLMLGCTLYYEADYRVESNQESGYGRFDLALFPKHQGIPGVLMEFKTVKEEKEMSAAIDTAKRQINEKSYVTKFHTEGVQKIWCYAIVFCGKHVQMDVVDV